MTQTRDSDISSCKYIRNLNRNIKPFVHGTAFEIVVCEMADIWLKGK